MGLMRFVVSPPDCLNDELAQQAYLSGMDRVPWEVHTRYGNGELVLERVVSESGSLQIPWPVEGYGQVMLSTGTLTERPQPYHLPLELARGEIGQVRTQQAEWEAIGLVVPDAVNQAVAEAVQYLGRAVQAARGSQESATWASRAIRAGLTASNLLTACYTEQALAVRRRQGNKLPTLLGANLGVSLLDESIASQYLQTFNAANVPLVWGKVETNEGTYSWEVTDQQLQWCRSQALSVCGGPLLLFDPQAVPDWLFVCEDDFESLMNFASEFVEATVRRCRGKVNLWLCAGRVNTGDVLSLSEEEKVRLAARAIELTHELDPSTPIAVSFDQPWAEYLSHRAMDFPPLHFADALVRAGLGLAAVMLEINMGYWPGGTPLRDPMDVSRQLDGWSALGVPLYVALTVPSAGHDDPAAQRRTRTVPETWTPKAQQAWVQRYVPLLLAKPYVQGVFWNQLQDSEPHDFPHGGLFDPRRQPKPALRQLASLRQAHLR